MEIVLILILAVAALVGGYFFLKKYRKMDAALFGDVEGYNPSGIYIVYASAVIGAIIGCIFMYTEMTDKHIDTEIPSVVICTIMALILCTSIYHSILTFDNVGTVVGKSLWLLFSCALAAVIGAVGSFIVFCVVVLWIMWLFVKLLINSFIYSESMKDEDGNTHHVRKRFSLFNDDTYEDEEGNVFKRKQKY